MGLRARFTDALKTAMLAKDAATTSTIRMIMAKLKDTDIAARKTPQDPGVPDDQVIAMLRGMAKSRRESVELYRQGNRPELAAKEEVEIAVIKSFLPQQMDDAAMAAAVDAAVAEAGAASIKDMGKVMAVLKSRHAAALDMAKAGPMVKARLGACIGQHKAGGGAKGGGISHGKGLRFGGLGGGCAGHIGQTQAGGGPNGRPVFGGNGLGAAALAA